MPLLGPEFYIPAAIGPSLGLLTEAAFSVSEWLESKKWPGQVADPDPRIASHDLMAIQSRHAELRLGQTRNHALGEGVIAIALGLIASLSRDQFSTYLVTAILCTFAATRNLIDTSAHFWLLSQIRAGKI